LQGLSKEAAQKRWDADFSRLQKEQRESNDLTGASTGKVARQHWQQQAFMTLRFRYALAFDSD